MYISIIGQFSTGFLDRESGALHFAVMAAYLPSPFLHVCGSYG